MHFLFYIFIITLLAAGLTPAAHAYIDPGTGALVVQAMIGAAATALVTLKLYWSKCVGFIRSRLNLK